MQNKKVKDTDIVLAVDPGYERVGIALVEKKSGKENLIHSECFKTSKDNPHHQRLVSISKKIEKIIDKFNPSILAIETLFFSKNAKTALLVAEARGVIISESSKKGLEIKEFMPSHIKMAVTGNGNSDKKAVSKMIDIILKLKKEKKIDDEYDAIAIGLTCLATKRF